MRIGGWRRFTLRILDHARWNKRVADAELTVQFEVNSERNDLGVTIEESFETAAGHTRTSVVSFTLKSENVEALRSILEEIDTTKTNP